MIAPLPRTLYRSGASACAAALEHMPIAESTFVAVGSRLSTWPGVGRVYRSVAFRLAERIRQAGTPFRWLTIAGRRLMVDVTEFTTYGLYFNRTPYEPLTTDFLIQELKPGDVFVDIGANHGYFTLIAASCVGSTGCVFAFEPNPPVFQQLVTHVRMNRFEDRVRLADVALSDAEGEATLFASQCRTNSGLSSLRATAERVESGALSAAHTVRVRTETFDRWYARARPGSISVMKIDVEGAEEQVVRGMDTTLRTGVIRRIVCETALEGNMRQHLADVGYVSRPLESIGSVTNLVFVRQE
jgi:FkbM family methyltransferase